MRHHKITRWHVTRLLEADIIITNKYLEMSVWRGMKVLHHLSEVPGNFHFSVCINKTAPELRFEAFFPNAHASITWVFVTHAYEAQLSKYDVTFCCQCANQFEQLTLRSRQYSTDNVATSTQATLCSFCYIIETQQLLSPKLHTPMSIHHIILMKGGVEVQHHWLLTSDGFVPFPSVKAFWNEMWFQSRRGHSDSEENYPNPPVSIQALKTVYS